MAETLEHPGVSTVNAEIRWKSLAAAEAGIVQDPRSAAPRVSRLRALVDLGLRTLVLDETERLVKGGVPEALLMPLVGAALEMPSDEIRIEEREQVLKQNLGRLPVELHPTQAQLQSWRKEYGAVSWLRAIDGNIVRYNKQAGITAHLQDIRSAASSLLAPLLDRLQQHPCRPVIFEGVDPPWFLQAILAVPPPTTTPGFRQRVLVVQRDSGEFYNGLACTDLGDELADNRLMWFVGEDGTARMSEWLEEHASIAAPQCSIRNPLVRSRAVPAIEQLNEQATKVWSENRRELSRLLLDGSDNRDASFWQRRFESADGGGEPLRVLVLTSRFSTYTRHASEDLSESLRELGLNATLLLEPDDCTVATESFYLNAVKDIDPDLIISVNYPRHLMRNHLPADVPFVCWVQDAMAHLFEREQGEAMGKLDFMVGMIKREMHEAYSYPADRLLWLPMSASAAKFHSSKGSREHECDISWVTHHGSSLIDLHDQLTADFTNRFPGAAGVMATALERVSSVVSDPTRFVHSELPALSREISREVFGDCSPTHENAIRFSYVNLIAERGFRLETARWAVSIAKKRGWTVRFSGRGWSDNPEFCDYAGPAVEHGAELASCYHSARVSLHASLTQTLHQRVAECAFAGGLPLSRVPRDAFSILNNQAAVEATIRELGEPIKGDEPGRRVRIEDIPEGARMVSHLRRLGLCGADEYADGHLAWPSYKVRDAMNADGADARSHARAFEGMVPLMFASQESLETLLEQAIDHDHWRFEQSERLCSTLRETMTTRAFAERVLSFVHTGITGSERSEHPPTR